MEVLVSLAIVSFGMLGVAKFQGNIMSVGAETKTRTAALYAAEQKLEELRSFASTTEYAGISSGSDVMTPQAGANAVLNRTWTVSGAPGPAYKTIAVDVSWTGRDNVEQTVKLTSYISKANPIASGKLLLADSTAVAVPPPPPPPPEPEPPTETDPEPETPPVTETPPEPPVSEQAGSTYDITVSGTIAYNGNGSKNWEVFFNNQSCGSGSNTGSYTCLIENVALGDTPSYELSISASFVCGTGSTTLAFDSSNNSASQSFTHAQTASKC